LTLTTVKIVIVFTSQAIVGQYYSANVSR